MVSRAPTLPKEGHQGQDELGVLARLCLEHLTKCRDLSKAEDSAINKIAEDSARRECGEVFAEIGGSQVLCKNLHRLWGKNHEGLLGRNWLSSNLVDFFMALIELEKKDSNVVCLTSEVFGSGNPKPYLERKHLSPKSFVLIPVCNDNHWSLFAVQKEPEHDPPCYRVELFDSRTCTPLTVRVQVLLSNSSTL